MNHEKKYCFGLKEQLVAQAVQKRAKEFMFELNEFFSIRRELPRIVLLDSRSQIDALQGKSTESWVVGWTKSNTIFLLAPDKLEEESSHKQTDFYPGLKHELVHLYYNQLAATTRPRWLNEGLATYLAGQPYSIAPLSTSFLWPTNLIHLPNQCTLMGLGLLAHLSTGMVKIVSSNFYVLCAKK